MATRTATASKLNNSAMKVVWTGLLQSSSDVGSGVEMSSHADRSFHVTGTFGSGDTVDIEGSNDGTNWALLKDPFGSDLQLTEAAPLAALTEFVQYVRPKVSAGDGTTDLTVTMVARMTRTPT